MNKNEQKIIGYKKVEDEFYPIFEPKNGQIVTWAFIFCKECNETISNSMGPCRNAICLECYKSMHK